MKITTKEDLFLYLRTLKSDPKAVIGIAVFIFLLDAAFLLRGQLSQLGRYFNEAGKLKAKYNTEITDIKLTGTYEKRLQELQAEAKELEARIPKDEYMPEMLETISKFSDICGVKILRINPVVEAPSLANTITIGTKENQEQIYRQKIMLSARSGFHQLVKFASLLENAPQFFDIKSIEIMADEQDMMRQSVTMVVEVVLRKG